MKVISGRELVKVLGRLGWKLERQKGSHMILKKPGEQIDISIPDDREVSFGCLRKIIRLAGLSLQEFEKIA